MTWERTRLRLVTFRSRVHSHLGPICSRDELSAYVWDNANVFRWSSICLKFKWPVRLLYNIMPAYISHPCMVSHMKMAYVPDRSPVPSARFVIGWLNEDTAWREYYYYYYYYYFCFLALIVISICMYKVYLTVLVQAEILQPLLQFRGTSLERWWAMAPPRIFIPISRVATEPGGGCGARAPSVKLYAWAVPGLYVIRQLSYRADAGFRMGWFVVSAPSLPSPPPVISLPSHPPFPSPLPLPSPPLEVGPLNPAMTTRRVKYLLTY